jgi:Tol biopolymer transport system component
VNTLEDDIRAVLQSQADAMQVPEPHLGRSLTLTLVTPRPRPRIRWILAAAAVLVLVVAAVVFVQRDSHKPAVVTTTTPPPDTTTAEAVPLTTANGWLAFAEGDEADDVDIYLVREGTPARRIAGSDVDVADQVCPAFSPDGTRLAYGQAEVTADGGFGDAGLVVAELTADGDVSATTTIALDDAVQLATSDGMYRPPCPIWSADGRWLAFGAGAYERHVQPAFVEGVWIADTQTDDIRQVPELSAVTDIEWAPDATELYIASDGAIKVYSVASDATRELADSSWGVDYIAASPDGRTIAVQGRRASEAEVILRRSPESSDLRVMDVEGTGDNKRLVDRGVISMDFDQMHGLGPVWSPDGARIAYQRVCGFTPDNQTCLEQHEVVVVTVNESRANPRELPPMLDMPQVVVLPPETTGPDGTKLIWWPFYVIWSPDSRTLLYGAWAYANDVEVQSVLAVRVDGETPPVVLRATDLSPYSGVLRLHFQSWGRQPG